MLKESVKIGYLSLCDSLPLFVALEKKFFEDVGLNVKLIEFVTGNAIISASLSSSIAGGLVGSVPVIFAKKKNIPISIEGDGGHVISASKTYCGLVVRKGSGIKNIKDLKRKTVAINGYNTNSDGLLRIAAIKAGVLESLNIITMPMWAMIDSVKKKLVDAAFVYEPYISIGQKEEKIKIIMDYEEIVQKF